ncbi:transposase, MuDR, MULE transposase domain protein [Tanacetum coccineum]
MSEELTYSMLHEMMMKKFNLEANSQINLSFKLSSFDYTVDITDDAEVQFFVECACNSEDEFAHLFVSERQNNQNNKFFNFFETTTFENNGPSNQDINATHLNNNFNNTSVFNNGLSFDLGQNYFQMNESICKNEPYHTNPESSFAFRSNEAYVDENNDSDDGVDENPHNNFHKWNNFMSFKPEIPDTPVYKSKPIISKQYSQQSEVKKGNIFDNKEALVLAIRLKALNDRSRVLRGKDIQKDILEEYKIHISYQQAWRGKDYGIQQIRGSPYEAFEMLPYYCYNLEQKNEGTITRIKTDEKGVFEMLFIAIGASIRTFLNYLRPVLMIDAAHLKGLYKGTNLVAVAMDGNNQIVPIAFGICKGETGPCWSWWMSVLRECIGDNPNLLIISDRHAAIALAVQNEFPLAFHAICCRHLMMNLSLKNKKRKDLFWKICKAYTREDFAASMNLLQIVQPDAYKKLCDARPERWSRAHCPLIRYNYMTSNSVESVNACSVIYRKEPVLKLAETYRAMVQQWYYERRKLAANMTYEITDWAAHKIGLKNQNIKALIQNQFISLEICNNGNFHKIFKNAIPPRMDNPQPSRPKNTKRIQSQGEEPRVIHCSRCTQARHRRDQCNKPFVVQPPGRSLSECSRYSTKQ